MGEIMKRREAIRINDWNKLYEKYPIGNKALNKTQSELYRMWRDGRKDSDYKIFNEKNCDRAIQIIMFDMIVKLQDQVQTLEKKIEEYEKQSLPVTELVEYGPIRYEPLFPTPDPNL